MLTELEDETVLAGILADISQLLDDVAINKSNIATNTQDIVSNTQDIVNLDDKVNTHLADYEALNTKVQNLINNSWKKVDNLSSPVKLSMSPDYLAPTTISIDGGYRTGYTYAVEFTRSDSRESQFAIFGYYGGLSAGIVNVLGVSVSKIALGSNTNVIGFYGATADLYVLSIYKKPTI